MQQVLSKPPGETTMVKRGLQVLESTVDSLVGHSLYYVFNCNNTILELSTKTQEKKKIRHNANSTMPIITFERNNLNISE